MAIYIGLLIFSFIITGIIIVPFIDFLYKVQFTHHNPISSIIKQEAKILTEIQKKQVTKIGTPVGGGILMIGLITILYSLCVFIFSRLGIQLSKNYEFNQEINILFFTFISFGLLGLYDDIIKIFKFSSTKFSTANYRKTLMILILSFICSLLLFFNLKIDLIYLPFIGTLNLGYLFIPLSTIIISFFTKSIDVTDGMDGLTGGILLISLLTFWAISFSVLDSLITIFLALWIGSLLAFLYFNVYPARIWLGNAGSLSFGATFAIIGLLLGKSVAMFIIGIVFVFELLSQILQIIYLKFNNKKLFAVTPIHFLLQRLGWPEPKIVQRLWLISIIASIFGLWLTEF